MVSVSKPVSKAISSTDKPALYADFIAKRRSMDTLTNFSSLQYV